MNELSCLGSLVSEIVVNLNIRQDAVSESYSDKAVDGPGGPKLSLNDISKNGCLNCLFMERWACSGQFVRPRLIFPIRKVPGRFINFYPFITVEHGGVICDDMWYGICDMGAIDATRFIYLYPRVASCWYPLLDSTENLVPYLGSWNTRILAKQS
jgi:hypothetical protein